ncbi:lipase, partial [Francisella tularensis subsp. holarctica]|nr:lipase [Francisella tularensis subsp. holarctica]
MENSLLISNFKQWLFLILLSSLSISSICYSNARS